jgi:GH24 family phage-related lysozyme (muramidase)
MESELMKTCNMKYDVITSGRSKGCISVLFSYERSKLLKRLNRRDSLNKIRVTRTHQERQVQGVTSRKKARVFLEPLEV